MASIRSLYKAMRKQIDVMQSMLEIPNRLAARANHKNQSSKGGSAKKINPKLLAWVRLPENKKRSARQMLKYGLEPLSKRELKQVIGQSDLPSERALQRYKKIRQ